VKLLFDANLSRRIVPLLEDLFPESAHISQVGLAGETADAAIWGYAKQNGFVIVTADADFPRLSDTYGSPPQVVRLE
jgi:predicted nuclease of predicted toxin-antitoxin system